MTYNLKEPKNSVGDKISPARSYQISSPHLVGENGNNCSQRHLYVMYKIKNFCNHLIMINLVNIKLFYLCDKPYIFKGVNYLFVLCCEK